MKTFKTAGTCSSAINYEVADGVVTKCEFVGGCPGNTQGDWPRFAAEAEVRDDFVAAISLRLGLPGDSGA